MAELTKEQQAAFDEILAKHENNLTPEELLAAVSKRGKECPLHALVYDCNNSEAALRYRLVRCRWILRHAKFDFQAKGNLRPLETRRVVNVDQSAGTRRYVATETAVRKKAYREELRDTAATELHRWHHKWGAILGVEVVNTIMEGLSVTTDPA